MRMFSVAPAWSYSKRQPQAMDMVNLVFVGSQEQVSGAFTSAGWTGSKPNSMGSGFGAIRAIAERNNYTDAHAHPPAGWRRAGSQPAKIPQHI